jgi:predicted kinase
LGQYLQWPVIDKDDVRDLLDDTAPGLAYDIMWNVARRQLLLGMSVICDSPLTGGAWHAARIATETEATLAVVECCCPDGVIWRQRINGRKTLNLPAHHQTDWDSMQVNRRLLVAEHAIDPTSYSHLVLDTLVPVAALREQLLEWLAEQ